MTPRSPDHSTGASASASSHATRSGRQSTRFRHLVDTASDALKSKYRKVAASIGDTRPTYVLTEITTQNIEGTNKHSFASTWREVTKTDQATDGVVRYRCDRSQLQYLVPVEAPPLYLAKGKYDGLKTEVEGAFTQSCDWGFLSSQADLEGSQDPVPRIEYRPAEGAQKLKPPTRIL